MQGCVEKYRKPHGGEDDFSTTPVGLDLAWTNRTRVTFACGLVNSATNLLCHFLYPEAISMRYLQWNILIIGEKILSLHLGKEFFEKHEEYSVTKQVGNFLSIAHSHASSS